MEITHPEHTARQLSGTGPHNQSILSVLATRTYEVARDGRCVLADDPAPLVADPVFSKDSPGILLDDSDYYPHKPGTDVVILNAEATPYAPTRRLEASVTVGRSRWKILVLGDRRCYTTHAGRLAFSEPTPFERMPIGYDLAYGGRDLEEEKRLGEPLKAFAPFLGPDVDPDALGICIYPRNPAGRGYLVKATSSALETLRLPNIEDPDALLTPENLVLNDPAAWPRMPVPAGIGWYGLDWFPRCAYVGAVPHGDFDTHTPVEVARQWAPAKIRSPVDPTDLAYQQRFTLGAHPALQFPHLRGDETLHLEHLAPEEPRLRITLPGEHPRIWTDGRNGKLTPTTPVIHTIRIDVASRRVSVVWRGSAPALRPYFPEELKKMPFRVRW